MMILLADAVTIVLYNTMVTFCEMPEIPGGQYGLAILAFFTVSCGGIAVGAIFGLITALITRTTQECRGGLCRKYQELVSFSVGVVMATFSSASVSCHFYVSMAANRCGRTVLYHSIITQ
jgi:NhaP-type Na+/H+ or K+/H+ antiporter